MPLRRITILYIIWYQLRNHRPVHDKNIQVMGRCGEDMNSTKVFMVGLKCSPLHYSQDKGCDLQQHLKYPPHHHDTIQSFILQLAALLYHNTLQVYLGDPTVAFQQNGAGR